MILQNQFGYQKLMNIYYAYRIIMTKREYVECQSIPSSGRSCWWCNPQPIQILLPQLHGSTQGTIQVYTAQQQYYIPTHHEKIET